MGKIVTLLVLILSISSCGVKHKEELGLEKIKKTKIESSFVAAKNWMLDNINSDGYFNYFYDVSKDSYSSKNNMIRQLMMSRQLALLSKNNLDLRKNHKKNLEYIFKKWYKQNGYYGYVYFSNKSKLGANAMLLRVLIYSPYFEEYKAQAYSLMNTLAYSQNKDGSFNPWTKAPDYEYDKDYLLTFYSGEALLAIIEFYEKTGDPMYLNIAIKSADYYIAKYVTNLEKNYYPAYVPWHSLAYNKLYKITKDKKYSRAIFILNDKLLELQNNNKTSPYYGRFFNKDTPEYGSAHSSSDSVYTEGLIYALEIALQEEDKNHIKKYNEAIFKGFNNLFDLQYIEDKYKNNKKVFGALRINEENPDIRVDTTSHFLDAANKYIKLFY